MRVVLKKTIQCQIIMQKVSNIFSMQAKAETSNFAYQINIHFWVGKKTICA